MKREINKRLAQLLLGVGSLSLFSPGIANETVTNPWRTDGFGSQFQTILYSIIYAELAQKTYLYTPFTSLEHNYDEDPEFIAKKEWLVNLIDHFPINRDETLQLNISPTDYIRFFESHLNECANSASLKDLKKIFRLNKERKNYFDPDLFHIAVHIRRPNAHDSRVLGTNTPDNTYVQIIKSLRGRYLDQPRLFHIFSQGDLEDFNRAFGADDVIFHLNGPVEDTFIAMVLADVLVTSTSSLSYTAALLSDGTIYYVPFWHPRLPNWIDTETLETVDEV